MCGGQRLVVLCPLLMTENAVTESTVTTVSFSLFQSATVLTKNEFLYCSVLLSGIFKPQEFRAHLKYGDHRREKDTGF